MTEKRRLGDLGEDYTARYLQKQGYTITGRNWHSRYGEIDIIAEVKTRKAGSMVPGELAVTPQKQQKLRLTAESYLLARPTEKQPRFDVAALTVEDDKLVGFTYYPSAF